MSNEYKDLRDGMRELKRKEYGKNRDNLLKYITARKKKVKNLFFRFMLLCIIIIIFFVSLSLYGYNYKPIVLSDFQYSYYKNSENLPPGIKPSGTENTKSSKSFLSAELLGKCAKGYCAISKETGLKRCPDGNYQLVYNTNQEECTRREFCDSDIFRYAVLSDGTTDPTGKCDEGIPCRCSNEKRCNTGIVSTFNIDLGSDYDPEQSNFSIIQNAGVQGNMTGYTSLVLTQSSTQFCKINPAFTNRLSDGCNFVNATNDKLDCQEIKSNIQVSNLSNNSNIATKLRNDIKKGDTSFVGFRYRKDNRAKTGSFPIANFDSGYLKFRVSNEDIKEGEKPNETTEIIFFQNTEINSKNVTVNGVIHLQGTNIGASPDSASTYGTIGFINEWDKDKTVVESFKIDTVGCTIASDGPNYKNMLVCTQTKNQPCLNGILSYNFDKISSDATNTNNIYKDESFIRNFCQQRSNTFDSIIRSSYLRDPSFYTMSCYLGTGCNDKTLEINREKGSKAAVNKYFPDVDVDGINNEWVIDVYFGEDGKQAVYIDESKIPDNSLLKGNIQPGDFWSVLNPDYRSYTTEKKEVKDGSKIGRSIPVSSLKMFENYEIGTSTVGTSIPARIRPIISINGVSGEYNVGECWYDGNQAYIQLGGDITELTGKEIPIFTEIFLRKSLNLNNSTVILSGIIVLDNSPDNPRFRLTNSYGEYSTATSTIEFLKGTLPITIYKQFSFSGGNYNTIVSNQTSPKVKGKSRYYTTDGINIIKDHSGDNASPLIPPQDITNIFLNKISTQRITPSDGLQDVNSSFKKTLSMYYPVWNQATFQQECVRCKPNLIAFPEIDFEERISDVIIQYSGRDFLDYEYNFISDGYSFNSFSLLDDSRQNTTAVFHLKNPNPYLEEGDFVTRPDLSFPILISGTCYPAGVKNDMLNNLAIVPQIIYDPDKYKPELVYGLEESINQRKTVSIDEDNPNPVEIIENGKLNLKLGPAGNFSINTDSEKPNGYIFGKKYRMSSKSRQDSTNYLTNDFGIYIVPLTSIISISEDGKTIETDVPISENIKIDKGVSYSNYVQFCRLGKSLGIEVVQNLENNLLTTGFGEEIKINKLTDGRISSIVVENGGQGYIQASKPTIIVSNYDYYPETP